ncbi:4HBT domain-containing protein [Mycena kentingensis (nom. inval.)]|nr:4HBT domain-containing protein [Mycena kentingensis (nom. inval.)]
MRFDGVTATLSLRYRAPTRADQFVVIRTSLASPPPAPDARPPSRKCLVKGTIESLDGTLLVEGDALFVQPRYAKLLNPPPNVNGALTIDNAAFFAPSVDTCASRLETDLCQPLPVAAKSAHGSLTGPAPPAAVAHSRSPRQAAATPSPRLPSAAHSPPPPAQVVQAQDQPVPDRASKKMRRQARAKSISAMSLPPRGPQRRARDHGFHRGVGVRPREAVW